jgi:hypothetical protein
MHRSGDLCRLHVRNAGLPQPAATLGLNAVVDNQAARPAPHA